MTKGDLESVNKEWRKADDNDNNCWIYGISYQNICLGENI